MPDYAKYAYRLRDYLSAKGIDVKNNRCRCLCGRHEDKKLSCKVARNAFYCSVCGRFGDIYDAVMLIENMPPDREAQFKFLEKLFSWQRRPSVCDCIERKEAELREATGDPEAFIETVFDITEKRRGFAAKGFYRTKVLGIFRKNFMLSRLHFDYCPFCGKRYDDPIVVYIKMKRHRWTQKMRFNKGQEYQAFVNKRGDVYLQDIFSEKIFLRQGDYTVSFRGENNDGNS
jgi:hypothetical protein